MTKHARNTDPSTSHRSARMLEHHLLSDKEKVLHAIREAGARGATFEEAEGPAGVRNCWRRCSDLLHDGLIVDSGRERVSSTTGRPQRVYVAVDPGAGAPVVADPQPTLFDPEASFEVP